MRSNPDQTLAEYRASIRPRPSGRMRRDARERPFGHVPTYPHVTAAPAPDGTEAWQYIDNPAERDAAEYASLVDHLVKVHGLDRDAVTRVAYSLRTAKRLHAMQR